MEAWLKQGRTQAWEKNCNIRPKSKGKRTVLGLSRVAGAGMGRQSHPQRWLANCLQNHEDSCEFLLAVVLKPGVRAEGVW